jgi:4-hydroxybenzoate polyprenyltransferase
MNELFGLLKIVKYTSKLFRIHNVRTILLFFYIGIFIVGKYSQLLDLLLIPFIFVLLYAGASISNYLLDQKTDLINKKYNPVRSKDIKWVYGLNIILLLGAFSISLFTSRPSILIIFSLFVFLLGAFYSNQKLKLSYKPLAKFVFMLLAYCLAPGILGVLLNSGRLFHYNFIIGLTLIYSSILIYSDVRDIKGDKVLGKMTLAVVLGLKNLAKLGLFLSTIGAIYYCYYYRIIFGLDYFVLIASVAIIGTHFIAIYKPGLLKSKKASLWLGSALTLYLLCLLLSLVFLWYR